MNRRVFIGALATLAAIPSALLRRRFGYMDCERWFNEGHYGKRVLCNGVDITDRCSEFDDVKGYAVCFLYDSNGKHFIDWRRPDEAAKEILTGRIEVVG